MTKKEEIELLERIKKNAIAIGNWRIGGKDIKKKSKELIEAIDGCLNEIGGT